MTKTEFRPLLLFLAKGCRTEFDREQIAAWFAGLSDLPAEGVAAGIARFLCEVGKWPDIATVRRFAIEADHGEAKSWTKALEETRQAIRRHGIYGQKVALAKLDESTRKTIAALGGWQRLCDWPTDQAGIMTAQFRDIYRDITEREAGRNALPADIRPRLADSTDEPDRWLTSKTGRLLRTLTESFSRFATTGERTRETTLTVPSESEIQADTSTESQAEPAVITRPKGSPENPSVCGNA